MFFSINKNAVKSHYLSMFFTCKSEEIRKDGKLNFAFLKVFELIKMIN